MKQITIRYSEDKIWVDLGSEGTYTTWRYSDAEVFIRHWLEYTTPPTSDLWKLER
jgi:hypothetical protein